MERLYKHNDKFDFVRPQCCHHRRDKAAFLLRKKKTGGTRDRKPWQSYHIVHVNFFSYIYRVAGNV